MLVTSGYNFEGYRIKDYINFSADIIGVIANGTAVTIEKIIDDVNLENTIEFSVSNYNTSVSFRPYEIHLTYGDDTKVSLRCVNYLQKPLKGIVCDLIIHTIFQENIIKLEECSSVREMLNCIRETDPTVLSCLPEEVIEIVEKFAKLERMYGNSKDDCLKEIRNIVK